MMKVDDFVSKMRLAASVKSLYVRGAFGAPANDKNKKRYCMNNSYNKKPDRTAKIMAAAPDVFFSDCCGIIKGVLWGFCADASKIYGGAEYKSNGVPDVDDAGMIKACKDASKDFSRIEPGMLVWMSGHVGIYVGDGKVVESTPSFHDGCQFTNLGNLGYRTGNWRNWTKCGHLPWVEYKSAPNETKPVQEPSAQPQTYHTVVKGDTMSKIAKKYGTTLAKLKSLNPQVKDLNKIYVGQKIRIS